MLGGPAPAPFGSCSRSLFERRSASVIHLKPLQKARLATRVGVAGRASGTLRGK
ncbi:MAG TPA: hypothetical protein VF690_11335 [Hymenobacter sp.]